MATDTMLAVVKTRPERGVQITRVHVPACCPHEVLVRVRATSVCGTDVHIYNWDAWAQARLALPRILGHEAAGEVVAVGADVQGIAMGDLVSAETHIPCGHCYQCRAGKPEVCRHLKSLGVDTDGTFIVASEVSPLRRQLAERIGATRVLNPLEVDIVEAVRAETNGDGVDVLLEMSGQATAWPDKLSPMGT
jgi:threonine dehydrogenase-like Zn-dependent dehydrogenase